MNLNRYILRSALAAGAVALGAVSVQAESLTIGMRANSTSVDPHFHRGPNAALSEHIYDALVAQDNRKRIMPSLAVSWGPISDDTWEFKLREGVTFHDGSPFTADDVVCSWARPPKIIDSPGSFTSFTQGKTVTKVDDYTVHIKTEGPYPSMIFDASAIFIVSDEVGCDATTDDYLNGGAAVGTGPYELVEFVPDQRVVLKASDSYWGEAPEFSDVTFLPITSNPSRVAALLAGDVDMIDQVPTADIGALEGNSDIVLHSTETDRVIFLFPDHWRENSPFVKGQDGSDIKSPLQDNRVRLALSLAMNRQAISDRVMEGQSLPAEQIMPEGFFGRSENLSVPPYDPERAKALLAEAGYADGFRVTLHGPNDRYVNDKQILEALAQMFTQIGIVTDIDTMPRSVYFDRASQGADGDPEFSLFLVGWGTRSGEASDAMRALIHSRNPDAGFGANNRGRYSNPEVDALIEEALVTVDQETRRALFEKATDISMAEHAIIPIHFQLQNWASRTDLTYPARTDGLTMAFDIKTVQ